MKSNSHFYCVWLDAAERPPICAFICTITNVIENRFVLHHCEMTLLDHIKLTWDSRRKRNRSQFSVCAFNLLTLTVDLTCLLLLEGTRADNEQTTELSVSSSLLKTCSRAKDSLQRLSLDWIWRRKDTERQRHETVCQPPYLPWRNQTVDKRQDDSVKTTGIIIVSTHFLFVSLHSRRQFSLSWQVQVKRCLCFGW